MSTIRLPTYFLSHGGGPWPYMKHELGGRFDKLEASLVAIRRELGERPRAVLMVPAIGRRRSSPSRRRPSRA